MSDERLGIAGVGLIGGSIALRGRAAFARIIGYDRDQAALAHAHGVGMIDETVADLASLAARCDTLVIALPVDAAVAALVELADVHGPALIIDVASVKAPLAAAGARVAAYVGTHPMAGRERSGVAAADAELFCGATWAYTPNPDPLLVERTRAFIAMMGSRPLEIDPLRHDAIVALTSHLPQVLSVVLGSELAAGASRDDRVLDLCGPGMLTMLRLASSAEAVWAPIVAGNATALAGTLRSVARELDRAATGLEAGESAALMSYFEPARSIAGALQERFETPSRSSAYRTPHPGANSVPPTTR